MGQRSPVKAPYSQPLFQKGIKNQREDINVPPTKSPSASIALEANAGDCIAALLPSSFLHRVSRSA